MVAVEAPDPVATSDARVRMRRSYTYFNVALYNEFRESISVSRTQFELNKTDPDSVIQNGRDTTSPKIGPKSDYIMMRVTVALICYAS